MADIVYVAIDTNILVRVISQGRPGCGFESWLELASLVEKNAVQLLVPEVVRLELKKQWRRLPAQFAQHIAKLERSLEKHLSGEITFSEIKDLGPSLKSHLSNKKLEKTNNAESYHDQICALLSSKKAIVLPLDLETWFRGKHRSWSGGLANPDRASEADCCLIESLLKFFEEQQDDGIQLLLCTENIADFAVATDKEKGEFSLHPIVREGLPPTELFITLESLVAFVNQHRVVEEPSPAVVQEALAREEARRVAEAVELEEAFAQPTLNLLDQLKAMEEVRKLAVNPMLEMKAMKEACKLAVNPMLHEMKAMEPLLQQIKVVEPMLRELKAIQPLLQQIKATADGTAGSSSNDET